MRIDLRTYLRNDPTFGSLPSRFLSLFLLCLAATVAADNAAEVIEITSESPDSFEEAIKQGVECAERTVKNVRGA